jgi:hypothetical protein
VFVNRKTVSALALVVLLLLITSVMNGGVFSTESAPRTSDSPRAPTKVYIDPPNGTGNVGEQHTVAVKIVNVTNLMGFDIQVRWGTAVLKYNSHTTYVGQPGGVLNPPLYTNIDEVNETTTFSKTGAVPGTTYWISCLCVAGIPFNGTGIVFTMTFDVVREGECDIYFTKIALANSSAVPIPFVEEDGYFYQTGLEHVPVADFTFFPDPAVANKTTAFDASSSCDPDAGGGISLYIWNFKDGTIENTTSPTINHSFATIPYYTYHNVELTVLDDQGGGSQSKPKLVVVRVVHPRPVAQFTVWPEDRVAVVDQVVIFDASESYDPDPGGNITEYRWNFGDGNLTNTASPVITHTFNAPKSSGYLVRLKVVDDSDGLESIQTEEPQFVIVVQRRDIEVVGVAAFPSKLMQGKDGTIDVTIANKGEAAESLNITAYYNTTLTDWIRLDETMVSDFPEQYVPELEFNYRPSLNNTAYHVVTDLYFGASPIRDDTKIRVGTDLGYWTLNPGLPNTAAGSPTLVSGTPLTTGGWIWEEECSGISLGPKKLNGDFAAGDWAFRFKLYATRAGVNATVWTRILKSDNPDPQAAGALITVIKDWTSIFTAKRITNTTAGPLTAPNYNGNVSVPSAVFTDEYLFFEFQLQVTENTSGDSTTNVVFQIGGAYSTRKCRTTGTLYSHRNKYTLHWDTELVSPGNYTVKVATGEVPHETNITNNIGVAADMVTVLSEGHDVAIAWVKASKAVVGHGYSLFINVTAKNYGTFSEAFNITVYANLSAIETIEVALDSRNSTIITFTWNTLGSAKGNYQIIAYAWPVDEEIDPADNTLIHGWVFVTIPGDVDRDRDVDIFDILHMAGVYGVKYPNPRYDPNCDIDGDGDVDIFDIVKAASNCGKSW